MIDTHCHLDDPVFAADLPELILRQKQSGVEYIVVPGVNVNSLRTVRTVTEAFPNFLLPALGLHPEEIGADYATALLILHEALLTQKWVAVGEIGLDYHFDLTYKKEQQLAFETQLEWAADHDLPVLIHSRDATQDCLSILQSVTKVKPLRGIMHCFSGSREVAEQIVEMGFLLGIGGVITFKNAKLADNLKTIPLSKLVLETDAPYLAPVPHRGERNESSYMLFVAQKLAEVYACSVEKVLSETTKTAKSLFRL